MGHTPTISIIVPVYQVEPYLRDCLDSILCQSFEDWEMLLVDDGSMDGGERICDEYACRDSRVRVFHQENAGLSAARNTGLDHAKGRYYTMIDPDDVLATPDYLQILYDALTENDADMSVCGHIGFPDGAKVPEATGIGSEVKVCTGKDFYLSRAQPRAEYYYDEEGNYIDLWFSPPGAHGKLYKREMFDHIRYPEGHILEDLAIAHRLYLACERLAFLEAFIYAYRIRPSGIYNKASEKKKAQEEIFAYRDLLSYSKEIGDAEMIDYARMMLRNSGKMLRNSIRKDIRSWVSKVF